MFKDQVAIMTNLNSCIAVFSSYNEAIIAEQILTEGYPQKKRVMLLKNTPKKNNISDVRDVEYLNQVAVPKDTLDNYYTLLQNGSFLLIANGTCKDVELAYQLLIKGGYMSSIHFHHPNS